MHYCYRLLWLQEHLVEKFVPVPPSVYLFLLISFSSRILVKEKGGEEGCLEHTECI